MKKNKEYIISPSALSYLCNHCQYLLQNYELYNRSISAGITTTLDGIEKEYFLGDCKKINKDLRIITKKKRNFSGLNFKNLPKIMGVLNLTPDSFSDGGKYFSKPRIAIQNAIKMQKMGADIIDIGAESTRPGAIPIKPEIEIKRLKPIIFGLKKRKLNFSIKKE